MPARADHERIGLPRGRVADQRTGDRAARDRRVDDAVLDIRAAVGEQRHDPVEHGLRVVRHFLAGGCEQCIDARDVGQQQARIVDHADHAQLHAGAQQRARVLRGAQRFGRWIDGKRDPRE